MYGLAGYVATAPKIKAPKGVAAPGPQEHPGNQTRPNNNKLRAQLARAQREEDHHG